MLCQLILQLFYWRKTVQTLFSDSAWVIPINCKIGILFQEGRQLLYTTIFTPISTQWRSCNFSLHITTHSLLQLWKYWWRWSSCSWEKLLDGFLANINFTVPKKRKPAYQAKSNPEKFKMLWVGLELTKPGLQFIWKDVICTYHCDCCPHGVSSPTRVYRLMASTHIGSWTKKHRFFLSFFRLPTTCFPIPYITATDMETHKKVHAARGAKQYACGLENMWIFKLPNSWKYESIRFETIFWHLTIKILYCFKIHYTKVPISNPFPWANSTWTNGKYDNNLAFEISLISRRLGCIGCVPYE